MFISCESEYTPKPNGYLRLDFPKKVYQQYQSDCPFTFEYPQYAKIEMDKSIHAEPCWVNVVIPSLRAKIYCSYKTMSKDVNHYLVSARKRQ